MARRPLQLCRPDVAEIIDELHRKEPPGWRKDRLLVIKLASRGELTSGKIADLAGICVSQVFTLVRSVREQGLESIWEKSGGGRPEGWRKGIPEEVSAEFERKVEANEFTTLTAAQRWLKEEHGLDLHYNRIWYWAKKLGGVLLVPRPSHSKKDDAASEAFPGQFAGKLQALNIPPGTRAKVWVMDEARLGLHTIMRKVWSKRGRRPVVAAQRKYEWDYLFGSLEVTCGEAHFCHIGQVNLECDANYLTDLAAQDPGCVHILVRDQAGFHLRDGDPRLPSNVRIVDLPPYSPEHNPCEQLWDLVKDELGNRIFSTIEALREALHPILRRWWEDSRRVLDLVGRPWLSLEANTSSKT
jgi:transposase